MIAKVENKYSLYKMAPRWRLKSTGQPFHLV